MYKYCMPFELVAFGARLLLLFVIDYCHANHYAERFHCMGNKNKKHKTKVLNNKRWTSIISSMKRSPCCCSMYPIALHWNSIHPWKNGHIHWSSQSSYHRKKNNLHWSHSKMYQIPIMAMKVAAERAIPPKPHRHSKSSSHKPTKRRTMSNDNLQFNLVNIVVVCAPSAQLPLFLHCKCDNFECVGNFFSNRFYTIYT